MITVVLIIMFVLVMTVSPAKPVVTQVKVDKILFLQNKWNCTTDMIVCCQIKKTLHVGRKKLRKESTLRFLFNFVKTIRHHTN